MSEEAASINAEYGKLFSSENFPEMKKISCFFFNCETSAVFPEPATPYTMAIEFS